MLSSNVKINNFTSQQTGNVSAAAVTASTGSFTSALNVGGSLSCGNPLYVGGAGQNGNLIQLFSDNYNNVTSGISLGNSDKNNGGSYVGVTNYSNPTDINNFAGMRIGATLQYPTGSYLSFHSFDRWYNYNNSERMRIMSNGNVGIGTTAPLGALDVRGNLGSGAFWPQCSANVYGGTSFDASNIVNFQCNASAYGRNVLYMTGRYEGNNDAWSAVGAGQSGRNCIIFQQQPYLNATAVPKFSIQHFNDQLGILANNNGAVPVMCFNNNGRVGINMSSPNRYLYVNGDAYVSSGLTVDNSLYVNSGQINVPALVNVVNGNPGDMISKNYGSGDRYGMGQYNGGITRLFTSSTFGGSSIRFSKASNSDQTGTAGMIDLVSIDSSGNMSIGTTNAENNKLALATLNGINTGISLSDYNKGTGVCYVGITVPNNGTNIEGGAGFSGMKLGAPQGSESGYVAFHTHWANTIEAERMRITKDGNVGIGLTNPTQLLDVNGAALVRGALNVSGASNLSSANFASNVTVAGNLNVSGMISSGDISVGAIFSTGASQLFSLDVSGNVTVASGLNVSGATTLGSLLVANITASGAMNVTGLASLNNVTVAGTLNVAGTATLAGLSATSIGVSTANVGTLNVTVGNSNLSNITGTNIVTLSNGLTINSFTGALTNGLSVAGITGADVAGSIWLTNNATGVGYMYISNGATLRQV